MSKPGLEVFFKRKNLTTLKITHFTERKRKGGDGRWGYVPTNGVPFGAKDFFLPHVPTNGVPFGTKDFFLP